MRRHRPTWAIACFTLLVAACDRSPTDAGAYGPAAAIPLNVPSDNQTVFAETRDFTVVGYFNPPLRHPGDVQVELFAGSTTDGTPLRVIRSDVDPVTGVTPRTSLDFTYRNGQAFGPAGPISDPALIVMTPDLVKYPGGFDNPTNKVVVTRDYYAAVVLGGVSRDFDTRYSDGDTAWSDLTAGTYTIRVTGHSGQLDGLAATRTITFDTTHAMLGRFSPDATKGPLLAYAAAHGYRTYIDPFPGFFSYNGYSYEITGRWMANNSVEVVNTAADARVDNVADARNDVLLYNISLTSATSRIEIGAIVANGLLNDQTTFHYYDVGEPSIAWTDATTGAGRSRTGTIATLPDSERLVVTRVESRIDDGILRDNRYDAGDTAHMSVDTDVSDGVLVRTGYEFSVFGVVAPIPSTVKPGPLAHQYQIDNSIDSVRYVIRSSQGQIVQRSTHPVGLNRRYDPVGSPGSVATSVYEFEHAFHITTGVGTYTLVMAGLDAKGQPVPAAADSFAVTVAGP
jgi:hypothetical protein